MAMSTSTTQASTLSWLVLNSSHTTATELKAELKGEMASLSIIYHIEVAGFKALLVCKGIALLGAFFVANGNVGAGMKILQSACIVQNSKEEELKCTVKTTGASAGTIETNELKGELVLVGSELLTRIEPISGPTGTIATIRFEGEACVLPELNQLHGTLYLKDSEGFATTHKVKHLFESSAASTALYVGGHSAKQLEITKILGGIWISLGSGHVGLPWSGMDV
jgi:hypothetical protein